MYDRRTILSGAGAMGLGGLLLGGVSWSRASAAETKTVRAILPSASSDSLGIKVLLEAPPSAAPILTIDGRKIAGRNLDGEGYAWGFVQNGLKGGTVHELALTDEYGAALREPWTLKTLPPLDSEPDHFRVLFFTCAGGDEAANNLSVDARRHLFDRALSFEPDLAVANGDHIYWDIDTALKYRGDPASRAKTAELYHKIAWIDEDSAFDSDTNRRSLNTVIGRQIASIYEDRFASVPLVFITDDHDYFENDNAGPWGCTFPPRPFTFNLQQRTAAIAYPFAFGRPDLGDPYKSGTVEAVRIGKLLELNLFDCRRGWSFGNDAGVLFPEAEAWLHERLQNSDARQLIHAPSNPFGWSAGKLGEWYSDGPAEGSAFANDKGYWQQGWFDQHQRLAKALSAQRERAAVSISGDMHASAISSITRSGDLDLSGNPIQAILPGTVGTGPPGFPSTVRGVPPFHAKVLEMVDIAKMEERNGFSIVDVYPERIEVRQFRWRPPEPIEAIASLEPSDTYTIRRTS
ncbi:MAG: hypothetical protein P0Y56_15265 [Candidatus Andeanibacterium colombiense]|uniref:PhoD-like phosphatase metallophosphatase domain-containing protein n=1 Tax=Candidatus Andeanibacterium colombiense TaxID=3121345 RepID=A0AAJ5X683_9SPHN|nr:MAG: hypothetical protein P0Y56_15265 [Sphingomonadaceae bacterium]